MGKWLGDDEVVDFSKPHTVIKRTSKGESELIEQDGVIYAWSDSNIAFCRAWFLENRPGDYSPVGVEVFKQRAPDYKTGDVLPVQYWNIGYSIGLQYPYIFHKIGNQWLIWGRHTGRVYYVHDDNEIEWRALRAVGERCRRMNSVPEPSAAERATINVLHDLEA